MNLLNCELECLNRLGLTTRQAEVYMSIVQLGPSTITSIARNAQVERSEVFRVMPVLCQLGLVRKILTNPATYEGLSVPEGVAVLLEHVDEKHKELCFRARQLVQTYKNRIVVKKRLEEPKYFVIYGQGAEKRKLVETLRKVKRNLDCIIDWSQLLKAIDEHFELFEKVLERGVAIRYLTNIPYRRKSHRSIRTLKKKGNFRVRRILADPPALLALVDDEAVDIVTCDPTEFSTLTSLRSTNKDFTAMMQDYFETKWRLAAQEETQNGNNYNLDAINEINETYVVE